MAQEPSIYEYLGQRTRGNQALLSPQQRLDEREVLYRRLQQIETAIQQHKSGFVADQTARFQLLANIIGGEIGVDTEGAAATERSRSRQLTAARQLYPGTTGPKYALLTNDARHLPGFSVKEKGQPSTITTMVNEAVGKIDAGQLVGPQAGVAIGEAELMLRNAVEAAKGQAGIDTPERQALALRGIRDLFGGAMVGLSGAQNTSAIDRGLNDLYARVGLDNVPERGGEETEQAIADYAEAERLALEGSRAGGMSRSGKKALQELRDLVGVENIGNPDSLYQPSKSVPQSLKNQKAETQFQIEQNLAGSDMAPYVKRVMELPAFMSVVTALGYNHDARGVMATANYIGENPTHMTNISRLWHHMENQTDESGLADDLTQKNLMIRLYMENQLDAGKKKGGMGHQFLRTRWQFGNETTKRMKALGMSDVEIGQRRRAVDRYVQSGFQDFSMEPISAEEAFASFTDGLGEDLSPAEIKAKAISYQKNHPNMSPEIMGELFGELIPELAQTRLEAQQAQQAEAVQAQAEKDQAAELASEKAAFESKQQVKRDELARTNTTDLLAGDPSPDAAPPTTPPSDPALAGASQTWEERQAIVNEMNAGKPDPATVGEKLGGHALGRPPGAAGTDRTPETRAKLAQAEQEMFGTDPNFGLGPLKEDKKKAAPVRKKTTTSVKPFDDAKVGYEITSMSIPHGGKNVTAKVMKNKRGATLANYNGTLLVFDKGSFREPTEAENAWLNEEE